MKKIIVVSGHGKYGTAMQSTLELLLGYNGSLYFIDFREEDTDIILREKFLQVLHSAAPKQVLFVCDILGGTPFKVAAELAMNDESVEVVAGVNVGSIIESIYQDDEISICDLAEFIVKVSKNTTLKFDKQGSYSSDFHTEDGI